MITSTAIVSFYSLTYFFVLKKSLNMLTCGVDIYVNIHTVHTHNFQLVVEHDEVRLYMDCGEAERATFHRRPDRLTFSHNSGIFVSNAGNTGLDNFVVSKEIL